MRASAFGPAFAFFAFFAVNVVWAQDGTIRITVTPAIEYGVVVDTASLAFTLGAGAPAFTTSPIGVRAVGNAQPMELDLQAAIVSSAPWSLAAVETPQADALRVYALFSDVSRSTRPADSDFIGATERLVTGAPRRAGGRDGGGAGFESPALGADMDGLAVGDPRRLWLRLDAPPASTTAMPQRLTITITATRDSL